MIDSAAEGVEEGKQVVPGSRAPSINVPALVNSMMRLVLKYGATLSTFVRSVLTANPGSDRQSAHSKPMWPIPVPYPESFMGGGGGTSGWKKRRVCLQVLVLDWLFLGKPKACPPSLKLGAKLSSKQWRRVRHMEFLSEDSNSLLHVDAEVMARAAAKTEAAGDELDSLHRALASAEFAFFGRGSNAGGSCTITSYDGENYGSDEFGAFDGVAEAKSFVAAKDVVASRIQFQGIPRFDPLPYMDRETAFAYSCPLDRAEGFESDALPPKVCVNASEAERNLLFRKMAETGRLVPVEACDARRGLLSGLFSVPKDLARDRLILDARPPNTAEPPLSRWTRTMSSSSCLAGIELASHEYLSLSGRDVRDFFYQFKVGQQRCLRNVLASWLRASDLEFIFGRKFESGGYVGLSTLAMGDLSACEYAQCAHLGVLLQSGGCAPQELLLPHRPVPRSDLMVGVVIDDLVCLEKMAFRLERSMGNKDDSESSKRMQLFMEEYRKAELPINEKKSFDNVTSASFWGVQIDGEKGLFRPNESRYWPLVLITTRIACLGVCTVALLQSLAGSWISIFCTRRRLSLMGLIFEALAWASDERHEAFWCFDRRALFVLHLWWFGCGKPACRNIADDEGQ